jgi:transcriptional regulator with XRE-family HTH domain
MTPLDSGSGAEAYRSPSWVLREPAVSLADAHSLADALRAARERSGRSHADLADATRVRRDYLIALEQGAWDRLPSRPFAIGYVRAYAQALGLDEETAADRFKAECPDHSAPLAAPVGSELDDVKPNSAPWVAAVVVVVLGVIGWNVAQHMMTGHHAKPSDIASRGDKTPEQVWSPGGPHNALRLGVAGPSPEGQGLPAPYVTPGMPDAAGLTPTLQTVSYAGPTIPAGAAFNPKGPIYGADAAGSYITIQARKPAAVVLRSPDGVNVTFAKQLAAGEAYRAPITQSNLVLDVSDPAAFDLYFSGEYQGPLKATVTSLHDLNAQAAQHAAQVAAQAQRAAAVNPDEAPANDNPNPAASPNPGV